MGRVMDSLQINKKTSRDKQGRTTSIKTDNRVAKLLGRQTKGYEKLVRQIARQIVRQLRGGQRKRRVGSEIGKETDIQTERRPRKTDRQVDARIERQKDGQKEFMISNITLFLIIIQYLKLFLME